MRKGLSLTFWFILFCKSIYATEMPAIRIAVAHFMPPFVIQNSNNDLSGFDIDLMLHICKSLDRKCIFIPMQSSQVTNAVAMQKADIGLGGIDIARNYINIKYSQPYMISEYRFLVRKEINNMPTSQLNLKNKTLGINKNSIAKYYFNQLSRYNNMRLIEFNSNHQLLSDLLSGKIEMAAVSNAMAIYWKNNSSEKLDIVGNPLNIGVGIGVIVNNKNPILLKNINNVIANYKKSPEYKQLYDIYFGRFS